MESLPSKNENVKYLLCVIDIFTKHAWVKPLKYKKSKTVLNAFMEIVNESNCKPNKLWVDQGRHFYNKLMQEWLGNIGILMYSTHNESKSVIAERLIKTLIPKLFKKMTANDNKSYLPNLSKLVNQYKNSHHHPIIRKPINADYSTFTEKIETNPKALKFKVNDRVRITKCKNILSKEYTKNWSREILIIDSVLKTNSWAYKLAYFNGEK